jgi:hypothetical protein
MDMYSILRIHYVHITPDSVVQYTPKYSKYEISWVMYLLKPQKYTPGQILGRKGMLLRKLMLMS